MEPMVVFTMSLMEAESARTRTRYEAAQAEEAFYAAHAWPLLRVQVLTRVAAVIGGLALYAGLLGLVGR
jgi:hypothetical protein